jgi:3-keto-5-aminohexanoate cleavage enzyme
MNERFNDIPERYIWEDRSDPVKGLDQTNQQKWEIPDSVVVKAAVVGGSIKRETNPNQPYTPDEIRKSATECIDAGAISVHLHPRLPDGKGVLDPDEYLRLMRLIVEPIKEKYGSRVIIDGCCLVPTFKGEMELMGSGLFEMSPLNPFWLTPRKLLQAQAEFMRECGVKPEIALYADGDLDRAKNWLIDTGIVTKPLCWLLLPSFFLGCTPLYDQFAMVEYLMLHVRQIRHIDPESRIMVCMAGRPSSYLTTTAIILGLDVRVGMEDTIFKWPHKNDLIANNVSVFTSTATIANNLGRRLATANEYRAKLGIPQR